MPPIQVLPAIPTFGNKLAQVLGGVASNIAEGIQTRSDTKRLESLVKQFSGHQGMASTAEGVPQAGAQPGAQPTPQPLPEINPVQFTQLFKAAERVLGKEGAKIMVDQFAQDRKAQMKEQAAIRAEQRAGESKEKEKLDKIGEDVVSGYDSARISEDNLDKMAMLIDDPSLISPLGAYLSDLLHVPVSLTSPGASEEFQKLAAQRGLNVASAYGFGRILQTEFNNFLQTIPSLLNSREGKTRIVNTLRYFDNLAKARYEEFRRLKAERKPGERAGDFQVKLTEAMKPYYDQFGQVLKYGDEIVEMKDPEGKAGKVRKSQVQEALDNGYTLAETK